MIALTTILSSCNKYEEGSKFTLLTAKARMVNTWTLTSYSINDAAQTFSTGLSYKLDKDGTATETTTLGGFSLSDVGTWEFNGDKTELIMKDSAGSTATYEIVQLKNKDLKVRQTEVGYVEEWTFTGL